MNSVLTKEVCGLYSKRKGPDEAVPQRSLIRVSDDQLPNYWTVELTFRSFRSIDRNICLGDASVNKVC